MARFSVSPGSGGTADTGDITFDGVKIIGAGEASGDGNGFGTMELVPDNNLYENDQYLIIDPTAPNHIHIRAGGEQDDSQAELILGGERTNVRVNDYGVVSLNTRKMSDVFVYENVNSEPGIQMIIDQEFQPDYVFVDGVKYSLSGDPNNGYIISNGQTIITIPSATFYPGDAYTFGQENGENEWYFSNTGETTIPGGIYNSSEESKLLIESASSVILIGYNGEFLNNDEEPNNQIATIGDLGIDTEFEVSGGSLGTQPTFDGTPLFNGSYVKTGRMIHFRIDVDFDNIISFGTGQYYLDLPFPSQYNYEFVAGCLHDISTGRDYTITGHVFAGDSRMTLKAPVVTGQTSYTAPFTSTYPITLDVADNFHVSGDYIAEEE